MECPGNPRDGPDRLDLEACQSKPLKPACISLEKCPEMIVPLDVLPVPGTESRARGICMQQDCRDIGPVPVPDEEIQRIEHLETGLLTRVHATYGMADIQYNDIACQDPPPGEKGLTILVNSSGWAADSLVFHSPGPGSKLK